MAKSLTLAVLVTLAATSASSAQFTDPHTTRWGVDGTFTLLYHGPLADGTICPPAANGLPYSLSGPISPGSSTLRSAGLNADADAEFGHAFASGSFCEIRFEGAVALAMHHGTSASIKPRAVLDRQPYADGLLDITVLSGRYEIGYIEVVCRVAPCPPGTYFLSENGQIIASADAIVFEDLGQSPKVTTRFADQRPQFDWAFGTIRLPGPLGATGPDAPHFPAFSVTANQYGQGD